MSIEWTRDEYGYIGTERRLGQYDFKATIRPGRAGCEGDSDFDTLRGCAEAIVSCWLARDRETLAIAHLIVLPHRGIAPTPLCERCSGTGSYVGLPGDQINDCPYCGGSGCDVVGQAQRFVEALWESARGQVLRRIGGKS